VTQINSKRSKVVNLRYSNFPSNLEFIDNEERLRLVNFLSSIATRTEIGTRHSEVVWQILKDLFESVNFEDSHRDWQRYYSLVSDNYKDMEEEKLPFVHRYLREIYIPVIAGALASGRVFISL